MRALAVLLCLLLPAPAAASCLHNCAVDDTGYALIKDFEGYSPFVYKDSGGVPTVGFGHAILPGEHIKTPLMGADALQLLKHDIARRTPELNRIINVPLATVQFDALTSFAYNVGVAKLRRSTLLRCVNTNHQREVHPQFLRWDTAAGRVLLGLKLRREAEAELYDSAL